MNIKCFLIEDTGKMTEWEDLPNGGKSCSEIWRRVDTGEEKAHQLFEVGAMWYATPDTQKYYQAGPDGRSLFVRTPGGDWEIDGCASNCTKPTDTIRNCWARHGVPPMITVDKVGSHCSAGAGSIAMFNYHGFLRNGELTDC